MEAANDVKTLERADAAPNPHVLWRQLLGLVLWVGVLSYLASGFVGAGLALALGGVTFADAWVSGIYKDPTRTSFLNISPMAWGIVMALLFVVAYPAYLSSRNRLRTRRAGNGFFIATIAIGAVVIVLFVINILAVRGVV